MNIQRYDVAGSEAERSHQSASSISKKQVVSETIRHAGRMTNVPYFKSFIIVYIQKELRRGKGFDFIMEHNVNLLEIIIIRPISRTALATS